MAPELDRAIALYIEAESSAVLDGLADCFAPDATVLDEGQTYTGLAAIKGWMVSTKRKYQHSIEPLGVIRVGGKSIVKVRMTGPFPGSPVTIDFVFTLSSGKIASVEIR